jgi:hypothetical protein
MPDFEKRSRGPDFPLLGVFPPKVARQPLGKQPFNLAADCLWLGRWREASRHLSVAVDQKLCEIPFDCLAAKDARRLRLQPFIERACC